MTSPFTATSRVSRRDWEDLAEKYPLVLAAAVRGGADWAVLFAESRRRVRHRLTQIRNRGRIEPPRFAVDERFLEGASISVERDSETWLERSTHVDIKTLLDLAGHAAGPVTADGSRASLPEHAGAKLDPRPLFEEMNSVSGEEAHENLRMVAEFATSLVPGIQRITVDLIETIGRSFVACAGVGGGAVAPGSATRLSLVVTCELESGAKCRVVRGSRLLDGQWMLKAAEAAARELSDRVKTYEADSIVGPATMPVLFEAGWCAGAWIHEVLGHALEADNIERGWSSFGDLVGEQIATTSLSVVDSPLVNELGGSMEWDDEAVSARDTVLVDAGRLVGVLHDRRSADLAGAEHTGNGRRQDYRYPAQPRMTNLIVRSGEGDPYRAAAQFPSCLVVKSMTEGFLDGRSGAFTFPVECAEMLSYGEQVSLIRDVVVSGSSVGALAGVVAIGMEARSDEGRGRCLKNGQVVDVGFRCPSILIEELPVAPATA